MFFAGCTSIEGPIIIDANPANYHAWLMGVNQNITITGSSSMLNELAERI